MKRKILRLKKIPLDVEFHNTFKLAPSHWCCPVNWMQGKLSLDILKFERFLKRKHDLGDTESMAECVRRVYGEYGVSLVSKAIDGEARSRK